MNRTSEVEMKSESLPKAQKKFVIRPKMPKDCFSGIPHEGS